MNNYKKHALREFKAAGWIDADGNYKDEIQETMCEHVLKLLDVFSEEGHSGSTAPYALELFRKLASFEPLLPLTGKDDEWGEPFNDEGCVQNVRDSAVMKDHNGAYYLDAIHFTSQTGHTFSSASVKLEDGRTISSHQYIKAFPFTPKTFYIDVIETEWADKEETIEKKGGGLWTCKVKDESQLKEVFNYYKTAR